MIRLRFSYGFPFAFLSVPMVFLWSSFGSPMLFIWFCWLFRWNSYNIFPGFSYGFPRCSKRIPMVCQRPRRPTVTDGRLTETDGKTQRVNVTDGCLTETDGSLTDMHGRGGQWSRRRWAAVKWILGLCWGRCPGVPLCRCAGVQVCRCAGDLAGVPIYRCAILPLISL